MGQGITLLSAGETRTFVARCAYACRATCPAPAAMNGKVFRADDPVWKTHYPPTGFGCRCFVMALTAEDMEKAGLTVSDSDGHLTQAPQEAGVNKRTGAVIEVRGTQYEFPGADGKPRTMTLDRAGITTPVMRAAAAPGACWRCALSSETETPPFALRMYYSDL